MQATWTPQEQFQCLNLLDYLSDLFTAGDKQSFTRAEVLVILNHVKNDPELFDPETLMLQAQFSAEVEQQFPLTD
jgi:hypothetical protein